MEGKRIRAKLGFYCRLLGLWKQTLAPCELQRPHLQDSGILFSDGKRHLLPSHERVFIMPSERESEKR